MTFLHDSIPPATEDFILKLQETGTVSAFNYIVLNPRGADILRPLLMAGGFVGVEDLNERRTKFKALCLLSPTPFRFCKQLSLDFSGSSFMDEAHTCNEKYTSAHLSESKTC